MKECVDNRRRRTTIKLGRKSTEITKKKIQRKITHEIKVAIQDEYFWCGVRS